MTEEGYPISGETHPLFPHWFDAKIDPLDTFEVEALLSYNDINHEFGPWACELLWDSHHRPIGFIRIHFERPQDLVMARLILNEA